MISTINLCNPLVQDCDEKRGINDGSYYYAKQKHPGCKKSARLIRSSIVNRYVRPKTLVSVEAKKLLIKNLFNYLNDIQ